ncbi:MAG: hypothetical protein RBU21_06570 [FCB group bacterium]|nr:hypothetical protein [FCB group bacterium]
MERAAGVYSAADGGFIVMGHRTRFPLFDFRQQLFLSKRDANGAKEWSSHFTAPMINTGPMSMTGKAVKETPGGGFIVAGVLTFTTLYGKFGRDPDLPDDMVGTIPWSGFLLCVDSSGKEKWRRVYRESDGAWGWVNDVAPTPDGGFVVACYEYDSESGKHWFLRKTDPQGNPEWDVDAPAGGYADAVQALADGGCILAGAFRQDGSDDDFFVLKADSGGNAVWSRTYASLGASLTFTTVPPRLTLRELADGSLLAAGAGYNNGNFFMLRTDANGNETGRYVQTTPLTYYLRSVVATEDGGCILGGDDQGQVGGPPYVIKIGSLGQIQWASQLETLGTPVSASTFIQPRGVDGYVAVLTTRTAVDDPHPGSSVPAFDFNIEAFALTGEGTVPPWPAR